MPSIVPKRPKYVLLVANSFSSLGGAGSFSGKKRRGQYFFRGNEYLICKDFIYDPGIFGFIWNFGIYLGFLYLFGILAKSVHNFVQ